MNEPILNTCQNEAEKNLEQIQTSVNKTGPEQSDSIGKIETDSTGREWTVIGGIKKWKRSCPKCSCDIWTRSRKLHKSKCLCKKCGYEALGNKLRKAISLQNLIRHCPLCGSEQKYSSVGNCQVAEKRGTKCKKCQAKKASELYTGKSLEERLGKEKANKIKDKISSSGKGRIKSEEERKNLSKARKLFHKNHPKVMEGKNNPMFGMQRFGKNNPNFGKRWPENKRKIRSLASKEQFIKRIFGGQDNRHSQGHTGNWYNKKGCAFMDDWSKKNQCNLRHALNEGEFYYIGYFADGYDKDKNIWFEYDEKHHYYSNGTLKKNDVDRMNKIIHNLGCEFYRYNERTQELNKYIL